MFESTLILILSTALFFFYWQATIQRILHRSFEREYFRAMVTANRLEFLTLRAACENPDARVDYARVRAIVKCDFQALTYMLRSAAGAGQRSSREDRLLKVYFHLVVGSLITFHWLRLREKPAMLELAAILQYFANVAGQRLEFIRVANLPAADYLPSR
ncbi:MAG: hypothetical protein ACLQVG_03865 [Terriglobia bacterium]